MHDKQVTTHKVTEYMKNMVNELLLLRVLEIMFLAAHSSVSVFDTRKIEMFYFHNRFEQIKD